MFLHVCLLLWLLATVPNTRAVHFQFPASEVFLQSQKTEPNPGFVSIRYDAEDNRQHFYLGDRLFDFRGFNGPSLLSSSVYEIEDLLRTIHGFGTPVTRTYTLSVSNEAFGGKQKINRAHISGWDSVKQDWIYNEEVFQHTDRALAMAARHGVKLIIPIINQDYGTEETDWVGNFNDLIRHRYNITSYRLANTAVDWFTDQNIRLDFKRIITKLLTRKNTFNGRVYGEDDTIMAWETGNEMNWAREENTIHDRPAPANWTLDVAQHIKRLAPNTLVMDGSFSRNTNASAWPVETLESGLIDVVSYHLYGDKDIDYYPGLVTQAEKFNKTLVIGEHGFYSDPAFYQKAYELFNCPGALIWSIRAHNEIGGFSTHGEGNNIYSYHVPGWSRQVSSQFDTLEEPIVRLTFEASYEILKKLTPRYPIPNECYPFYSTNATHFGISWKGAAWAKYYEIWAVQTEGGVFQRVASQVFDNVDSGTLFVAIDPVERKLKVPKRPPVPLRTHAGYVDKKWFEGHAYVHHPTATPRQNVFMFEGSRDKLSKRRVTHRDSSSLVSVSTVPIPSGAGWYSVRPISVEGYPGPFSKPIHIACL